MTDSHEIIAVATMTPTYIERPAALHPLVALAQKQSGEINVDTLRELMALQREYEAGEAKKSFTRAMVALKAEMPSVLIHDSKVGYETKSGGKTSYTHTSLGSAIDAVTPHLAKFGFSLTWSGPPNTTQCISVVCRLSHSDGHFEEMQLSGPPDSSGGKNPIQAIGSTAKYLQRYTALMLLGIATQKDIEDADSAPMDAIDIEKNLRAVSYLKSVGIDLKEAEMHVQRDMKKWTAEDLSTLRELARSRKQQPREPGAEG